MLKNGKSPPWRCGVSHRRWYKEEQARNPQLFAARSRKYREVHAAELNYRRTVDRRRKRIDSTRTLIAELEKELLNA